MAYQGKDGDIKQFRRRKIVSSPPPPPSPEASYQEIKRRRFGVRDRRPNVEAHPHMAIPLRQEYDPPPQRLDLSRRSTQDHLQRRRLPPRPRLR